MAPGDLFFRAVKQSRKPALLQRYLRDLESGLFDIPKSFNVLAQYRTEELKLDHGKALSVKLPENELMRDFYKRYPEAKSEEVMLNSFQQPVARQFTQRQLHLMSKQRISKEKAFAAIEQELKESIGALRRLQDVSTIRMGLVQQDEEASLRTALVEADKNKGLVPTASTASKEEGKGAKGGRGRGRA